MMAIQEPASYTLTTLSQLSQHSILHQGGIIIIIIIMAGMAVFDVAGYLIEERRRWPVITASPRGQCSK